LTAQFARECPARYAALRDGPAALALRLFRDGAVLDEQEIGEVLDPGSMPEGLIFQQRGGLRSAYKLDIIHDYYLFSDWASGRADEVLPPGETTAILFHAAQRAGQVNQLLDVGCGSGTLSILLAKQAAQVIATDINPRALALSRLNATVNGITNIDFRLGSLFEPVREQSFDLIVSQPPYIPQPAGASPSLFLTGGKRGDELARHLLQLITNHLSDSGRALVFSDWPLVRGETLAGRIPHDGVRARVFRSVPITVEAHAGIYGLELIGHYEKLGIVSITQALVILERGSAYSEEEVLSHEWLTLQPRFRIP
jgi:SAM-dependent methyltransferase